MIFCTDVGYRTDYALAAGVLFTAWTVAKPDLEHTVKVSPIADYVSGEFYRRELPCLLKLIESVNTPITTLVIDGFVWLEEGTRKGLGAHLHDALNARIPIIGVAKTPYRSARATEVRRGKSATPLYVTSAGIDPQIAADHIQSMHGPNRIPTLIKRADFLSRQ